MWWRIRMRAHEWLADRVDWIQYPRVVYAPGQSPPRFSWYRRLNRKQRGWVFFFVFWGLVCLLSIYGNLID